MEFKITQTVCTTIIIMLYRYSARCDSLCCVFEVPSAVAKSGRTCSDATFPRRAFVEATATLRRSVQCRYVLFMGL